MSQKTDGQITQDVLDEVAWDPAVTLADLTVSTDHGRVRLNGTADTFGTKLEAEDAAYHVGGVTSVDNQIVVDPAALGLRSDADIADDVRSALELDYQVPDDRLSVSVIDGIVTFCGRLHADAAVVRPVAQCFEHGCCRNYPALCADSDRLSHAFPVYYSCPPLEIGRVKGACYD